MTQLACSTYSFGHLPVDKAIAEIAALGFEHVEVSYFGEQPSESPSDVRTLLERAKVEAISIAFDGDVEGDPNEVIGLASAVGAEIAVIGTPRTSADSPTSWEDEVDASVRSLLGLSKSPDGTGVTVALEIPRRGSLADDLESYRSFSRRLVRHRIPLSVDTHEVAEAGLSVNELWRYFASRIAHVRLSSPLDDVRQLGEASEGDGQRVDLEQWGRMAFAYGYPGAWVLRPDLDGLTLPKRRAAIKSYRKAVDAVLGRYAELGAGS